METDGERPNKTVLFVLDRSGSMSGEKIDQAKNALKFVLNNLREGDLFNIIAYDSRMESFRPELESFYEETRRAALAYIDGLYAGGGTNIHDALTQALRDQPLTGRRELDPQIAEGGEHGGRLTGRRLEQAQSLGDRSRCAIPLCFERFL